MNTIARPFESPSAVFLMPLQGSWIRSSAAIWIWGSYMGSPCHRQQIHVLCHNVNTGFIFLNIVVYGTMVENIFPSTTFKLIIFGKTWKYLFHMVFCIFFKQTDLKVLSRITCQNVYLYMKSSSYQRSETTKTQWSYSK